MKYYQRFIAYGLLCFLLGSLINMADKITPAKEAVMFTYWDAFGGFGTVLCLVFVGFMAGRESNE